MVQHMSQTDHRHQIILFDVYGQMGGGGRCSIMEKFFLVTRQRPATSTFCTYVGDWLKRT